MTTLPTLTTLPTSSAGSAGPAGPGMEPAFETGVPDAVVSFSVDAPLGGGPPAGGGPAGRSDEIARSADGDLLVTTWGSSTCPRMPVAVMAIDLTTIDVVTGVVRVDPLSGTGGAPENAVCAVDVGPTTSTIRLPEGAAGSGALTVVVDGTRHTVA